jgi:hypothetical protein
MKLAASSPNVASILAKKSELRSTDLKRNSEMARAIKMTGARENML